MKKFLILTLAAALLCGFALPVLAQEEEPPVLKVGDQMADFNLKEAIMGRDVSFSKDFKGKAKMTAVVFMNTGCSACLAELQEVNEAVATLGKDTLQAVAIAVDKRGEAVVKAYNETHKFDVTYLLDTEFTLPPMYGFSYTPAMIIVDKKGSIVYAKGGYNPHRDKGKVAEKLKELAK